MPRLPDSPRATPKGKTPASPDSGASDYLPIHRPKYRNHTEADEPDRNRPAGATMHRLLDPEDVRGASKSAPCVLTAERGDSRPDQRASGDEYHAVFFRKERRAESPRVAQRPFQCDTGRAINHPITAPPLAWSAQDTQSAFRDMVFGYRTVWASPVPIVPRDIRRGRGDRMTRGLLTPPREHDIGGMECYNRCDDAQCHLNPGLH